VGGDRLRDDGVVLDDQDLGHEGDPCGRSRGAGAAVVKMASPSGERQSVLRCVHGNAPRSRAQAARRAELLDVLDGEPLEPRTFTSTYFDTADRRLLRRGLTLRRRVEGGVSRWSLSLPQASGRLEVHAEGGPMPPQELFELLTAFLGGRKLGPAATLRTRRNGVRVRNGAGEADVSADEVAILEGSREVDGFAELDVELVTGDETLLDVLERRLHEAGARKNACEVNVERALGTVPPAAIEPPAPDAVPLEHLLFQLRTQYEEIVRNDPGVRLGIDPEAVHDMRVAIRRLRAMLRAAREMLAPEWSEPLRAELRWLGGELGPLRDADVFLEYLREEQSTLDERDRAGVDELIDLVQSDRGEAHARAIAAVRTTRYVAPPRRARAHGAGAAGRLCDGAAGRHRQARVPEAPQGRAPHGRELARRRAARPAHPREARALRRRAGGDTAVGEPAAMFVKEAKRFQDVVGEHQDAVVARPTSVSCRRAAAHAGGVRGRAPRGAAGAAAPHVARRPRGRLAAPRLGRAESLALTVKAAGGVVRREGQVLVVHRPKYDDWTLPKGKCKKGESWEQCALREVEEETGLRCELGPWVGSTRLPRRRAQAEDRPVLVDDAARRHVRAEPRGRRGPLARPRRGGRVADAPPRRADPQRAGLGGDALGEQLEHRALADAAGAEPERDAEAALHLGQDQHARQERLRPLRRDPEARRDL
jgi:8-oxo-dGTP pyrophosphatase MutT (NUDIX family)/inorganic triphosphatase YgiF